MKGTGESEWNLYRHLKMRGYNIQSENKNKN